MEFHAVCSLDDLWEGEMEVFGIGDREVLLVHAPGGEIRAFDPICPHQEHPLIEGEFEDCILTCSAHLWQFDVISGDGINPTGVALQRYPVKVDGDTVMVSLPPVDAAQDR
jgi:toluene monooxygenase system ferredoxin subunit